VTYAPIFQMVTLFLILIFLIKIGNHHFYLSFCTSYGEGLKIHLNDLEISQQKSGHYLKPLKRLHIFFFVTTLILHTSLIFTPVTPTTSYSEAASYTGGLFPLLCKVSGLIFVSCLHFTQDFTSLRVGSPLKSCLPLLVQCRFFIAINYSDLGLYFSHGYAFFSILTFLMKNRNS